MANISLQAAATLPEWSLSTIRRRIADGILSVQPNGNGNRIMICFDSIRNDLCIPLDPDDIELIKSADAGSANAQNNLGLLFLENNKPQSAIYWLELSTKQDFPDAMHILGNCYLKGIDLAKDENLAMMWIAKAASLGHPIAMAQMKSIQLLSDDDFTTNLSATKMSPFSLPT